MSGVPVATGAAPGVDLEAVVRTRFERTTRTTLSFFDENDERVARACLEMARRFARGGRLLVAAPASAASDAAHVVVEFVHPVLVGKRALPALGVHDLGAGGSGSFVALGRGDDIAMVVAPGGGAAELAGVLEAARAAGMLTLLLAGAERHPPEADFAFRVPDEDPLVAQEVIETLYHVLWELVHVFLDREDVA